MSALHDIVLKGSTDRSVTVRIIDSTDGTPELAVVFNTSGIAMWYRREGAVVTQITEVTLAALTTAHTDGGFLHVSDGEYRLDLPDAAYATGANYVDFGGLVTGMIVIGGRVRLVDVNLEDTVRAGLTALPNAAAAASGGLHINGSNSGTTTYAALTITGAMTFTGNVSMAAGLTVTQSTTNGHGIVTTGNGTGAGFRVVGGATGNGLTAVGGSTSGHGIQATVTSGNEIDADLTGAVVGNITGNLSGSVGSVTAAVSANVTQFGGTNLTATAGIPSVNTIQWKGTAPLDLTSQLVQTHLVATSSGAITATSLATDAIGAAELASGAVDKITAAIKALVIESEGSVTVGQALSVLLSGVMGETASGVFKSPNGVATRASVTYVGNDRDAVTLTPSS